MKVLQINCVYKKGSTGKMTYDIHTYLLQKGVESVVCYGRGKKIEEKYVHKVCDEIYAKTNNFFSRVSGIRYGGCFFSTIELIHTIKKIRPDIVHLQCINGHFVNIYKLVEWLKHNHMKTVLTLHAEFMYTGNCSHAYDCDKWTTGCGECPRVKDATKTFFRDRTRKAYKKMEQAFERFDDLSVISVSPWVKERAERSLILKGKNHQVIYNGVNTVVYNLRKSAPEIERCDFAGKKIVLHVTPFFTDKKDNNKGGHFVLDIAKDLQNEDLVFLVIGPHDLKEKVPENVILLGEMADQELLAKYYAVADVTLLTSRRETFSMVCAESLCCGTPVVGFKAGGPEAIALLQYSEFVDYGDVKTLEKALLKWAKHIQADKEEISAKACQTYAKEKMAEQYFQEYRRML